MTVVAPRTAARTVRRVAHVMGMPVSLALRGPHADSSMCEEAWAQTLAILSEVDAGFSPWRPDSVISRIARAEMSEADGCAELPGLAEVVQIAERARVATRGAFDVRRVRRPGGQGLGFDPSGVVKGWAAERAAAPLLTLPDTDVCLSVGGDLIGSARELAWRIGIEDPSDPSRTVAVVPLLAGAVATSGSAHRGAHIRDARDGSSPVAIASVSVLHDSLMVADVEATCAYLMGPRAGSWLRRRGRTGVVVHLDGHVEIIGPD